MERTQHTRQQMEMSPVYHHIHPEFLPDEIEMYLGTNVLCILRLRRVKCTLVNILLGAFIFPSGLLWG